MHNAADQEQESMVRALVARWIAEGRTVQRHETHISRIVVADKTAWKFKKPVRLGFLDFSSLAARAFYCGEELRLNRRLAPGLYRDVVRVTGSINRPEIDGEGDTLDWAVRMEAFDQESLWMHRVSAGELQASEVDQLAAMLAAFHAHAPVTPPEADAGSPACIGEIARETEDFLLTALRDEETLTLLRRVQAWNDGRAATMERRFAERKAGNHVRECHGDLHLGNILTIDGQVQVFDCIEFNERMRCIDVMNDLAFACMDLRFHGRTDLAAHLLNRYLELTGDFDGLDVFRYYEVQRALVRAKIALIELGQDGQDEGGLARMRRYLATAEQCMRTDPPALVVTHGLSGCGKSTLAAALARHAGMVVIRSDVERKRLHGMTPTERGNDALYDEQAGRLTYRRLAQLAGAIIAAGFVPVIDAACLRREHRSLFLDVGRQTGARVLIIDIQANDAALRARLVTRQARNTDASDAGPDIMSSQLALMEPLAGEELASSLRIDSNCFADDAGLRQTCRRITEALAWPTIRSEGMKERAPGMPL